MSAIAAELRIRTHAKRLRLPLVAGQAVRYAEEAAAARHDHLEFLAALLDASLVALAGYGAFRLVLGTVTCKNQGNCVQLTPITLLILLAVLAAYLFVGTRGWNTTPGQRLFRVRAGDRVGRGDRE